MADCRGKLAWVEQDRPALRGRAPLGLAAAAGAAALMLLQAEPARAQWIDCPNVGQPLVQIPELVSQGGRLRGTIVLQDEQQQRLAFKQRNGSNRCAPQRVRNFIGVGAVLPGYRGAAPAGYPGAQPVLPVSPYADPLPGPTLRARVGDLVQLTFLNQVDPNHYGNSIDRGETGQGCDETTRYPGLDTFPDCFHGSSTGNIHFHGTHTNPGSTGDNVFIEVRPSVRVNGRPVVTEASVEAPFDEFFFNCETELSKDVLSQWPHSWNDFPRAWTETQADLLKRYDSRPEIANKLLPVDRQQAREGAWPQYYIGAFPYCFRLPEYVAPPPADPQPTQPAHVAVAHAGPPTDEARTLQMGQAPGTHWYHAHKHGSTTINVANGMTGAFIIEGGYDDMLNRFYGPGWARRQPVLVINQLGVSPNLMRGGGPHQDFSVNGRLQPTLTMQPGEVQLWRIVNTSSRSGAFFTGFANPSDPNAPPGFQWKQIAQDGVQFAGPNYDGSENPSFLMAAGNRVDLLVKAPANASSEAQTYALIVQQARSYCETLPAGTLPPIAAVPVATPCDPEPPVPLLFVEVSTSPAAGNLSEFVPTDQVEASFPTFLGDIADADVQARKTVVFESLPTGGRPAVMHTIDGHKFDGNIGQVVLLNTVEEWKIENRTVDQSIANGTVTQTDPPGLVDHPFHIHINPFQIVELFNPNEMLVDVKGQPLTDPATNKPATGADGKPLPKYVFSEADFQFPDLQCLLDAGNSETWEDCHNVVSANGVWWDVFPIPSGAVTTDANGNEVIVPGHFRMRSRFVDYTGQYVIHCHILAHEDRGMMTIVDVVPFTTAYSHK